MDTVQVRIELRRELTRGWHAVLITNNETKRIPGISGDSEWSVLGNLADAIGSLEVADVADEGGK
jgi:hypothetical protein